MESEIHKVLNPAQQVIKCVNDQLVDVLGGDTISLSFAEKPPTIILLAGLQGVGKTTSAAKAGAMVQIAREKSNPYRGRPSTSRCCGTVANSSQYNRCPSLFKSESNPIETAEEGLSEARRLGRDVVICDTAGRLSVDEEMMEEIRKISDTITPHYTFSWSTQWLGKMR